MLTHNLITGEKITRRQALGAAVIGAASVAGVVSCPWLASAAEPKVEWEIGRITGGKKAVEARVELTTPPLAENGAVVPVNVEVASPMSEEDHVKSIAIIIDNNPEPHVMTVHFSPDSGAAYLAVRLRMAKSSLVRAFATMSDGVVYTASRPVKVTIGGCG